MDVSFEKWEKSAKVVATIAPIISLCVVIAWYSYLLWKDRKAMAMETATANATSTSERKDVPPILNG